MPSTVSFPPHKANQHGRHAPTAAKDDVYWNGDVISKRKIVEEVDGEKEKNIREPACKRDRSRLQEKGRVRGGEVMGPREECRYDKLKEGDEKT